MGEDEYEVIRISTHREFVAARRKIIAALSAKPGLVPLLALNPVLAMREARVELSAEVADHVLRSVQHPPPVRAEREELSASLQDAVGQQPRPNDPAWVASTLFERWKLSPLDTTNAVPVYRNAIPDDALARLQALRRRRDGDIEQRPRLSATKPPSRRAPLVTIPDSVLRLDLEAPVPRLRRAKSRPNAVALTELWFYRDAHPLVTPLLRLGIIERGALPIFGPDAFRKAMSGERTNQLLRWIRVARFTEGRSRK